MSAKGGFTIIDIEDVFKNGEEITGDDGSVSVYYKGIYDTLEKAKGYGKPIYINGVDRGDEGVILPIISYVIPSTDYENGLGLPIKISTPVGVYDFMFVVTQDDKCFVHMS